MASHNLPDKCGALASEAACVSSADDKNCAWMAAGKAVRFQWNAEHDDRCRVDHEMMMEGNLDSSSGQALSTTDMCGCTNADHEGEFGGRTCVPAYTRLASGSADASPNSSPGTCLKEGNFAEYRPDNVVGRPKGRIPIGRMEELPNHHCGFNCDDAAWYCTDPSVGTNGAIESDNGDGTGCNGTWDHDADVDTAEVDRLIYNPADAYRNGVCSDHSAVCAASHYS